MTNIPLSSKATALAIGVEFEDFRTGAPTLQQRLFAIGQGASAISYANEKFVAASPGEVGAKVGYGSPLHLMASKIFPRDGTGAKKGAVEVTLFPLSDPSGGVAAQKTIDAVGLQTAAKGAQLRINDLFIDFVIAKDSDNDTILPIIKDAIDAQLSSPITAAIGSGSATAGYVVTGVVTAVLAAFVAVTNGNFTVSVSGTPQEVLAIDFTGDLSMDDVAATITTILTGAVCTWDSATSKFIITNSATGEAETMSVLTPIAVPVGTDISGPAFMNGLTGVANVVPGTDADDILTLTTKWEGGDSSGLDLEIIQEESGLTFIIEDLTSGAGVVDIAPALAAMGNTWYTMLSNQFIDTTNMGKVADKNETLWDPFVNRFFVSAMGQSDRSDAETIADARKTDRTNVFGVADDCNAWDFEIGARNIAEIVSRANLEPNRHYTGLALSGLTPGSDTLQPEYTEKDSSLKKGVSTLVVRDGVIKIEDMVTFYHPDNEQPDPGYQWLVDIVKLQNIANSVRLKFGSPSWEGMTILADDDISTLPTARRPKDVKGAYFGLSDSWVAEGWTTDTVFTKENMVVVQSPSARNRFVATVPVKLSGSLRQQDYTLKFGFDLA